MTDTTPEYMEHENKFVSDLLADSTEKDRANLVRAMSAAYATGRRDGKALGIGLKIPYQQAFNSLCHSAPKDVWEAKERAIKLVRGLIADLDTLEPDMLDIIRLSPDGERLRAWLAAAPSLSKEETDV